MKANKMQNNKKQGRDVNKAIKPQLTW